MPILQDIEVWRGNDVPSVEWRWPAGYVASLDCQLTIWIGETLLLSAMTGGALIADSVERRFLWARTLQQSRLIPFGRVANYELEDKGDGERTIFAGLVNGRGGLNLDGGGGAPGQLDFSDPANSGLLMLGWF